MNKRIEEIAIQCGAWHQIYDHKKLMVDRHFDVERFAKLIIGDCGAIADKFMDEHLAISPSNEIKQYFGVKE